MRSTYLPYGRQWIDDNDIVAVAAVLKYDLITTGAKVREFEDVVASYCGVKYAVAFSSGTVALHATCLVAGVKRGDEVITTPVTFFADVSCIVLCGGIPILVDIREDTINIDPAGIESKITERTRAIIPVDLRGHPADLDEINGIAKKHGLVVIEDACHSLGAEYKGRKVGGISNMTVFSFHPVKHITTGEGGMVVTDSKEYYEKLCMFRNHNIQKGLWHWQYDIQEVGYNYRLTDFQSALGISQFAKLESFVARRRQIARRYNEAFAGIKEIITPIELDCVKAVYHLYAIQLVDIDRDSFMESLVKENIGVQIHYIPIHYFTYMQRASSYKAGDFPKAEEYYRRTVSLPIFPKMTDDDVQDVINAVRRLIGNGDR